MKFTKKLCCAAAFVFCALFSNAQLTVNNGPTALQLAQILAGPNITVTNASLTGAGNSSGSFNGATTNLGFGSGVMLSTGNISGAIGPNNATNTTGIMGEPGTGQMDTLAGTNTFDAVTLQFDFEVQSSSIQFEYIFASEEYPEYAPPNNSSFNDVFAFYISGPGITGQENIALVPGSPNPVTINNINPVTNNQYYFDNANGATIQYDAFTTVLTAEKLNLTPCQTYTLTLVIADAGDDEWDSGVFLKENSLVQGTVDVQTQTVNADAIALEGCIPASFTFGISDPSVDPTGISFTIGGTAINGIDYQFVDDTLTIPAGQTSATIFINSISDGLIEGQETVYIIYQAQPCSPVDTAFLYINDAQPIDFNLNGSDLYCFEDSSGIININATGGFPPYNYNVIDSLGNSVNYASSPINNMPAGEYYVQVFDSYGCQAVAQVIGGSFNAGQTFLPDGSGVSYTSTLAISGFDPGATLNNMSQLQQICASMEHSYLGDLQIRIISPSGQAVILKEFAGGGSCDLGEPIATAPVDGQASSTLTDPGIGYSYCWNDFPVYGTMVAESGNFTRNYTDGQGNNYTDNYLPAGSYASFENLNLLLGSTLNGNWIIEVTDQYGLDNGYIFSWDISLLADLPDSVVVLDEPDGIDITGIITQANCGGSDGAINTTISGDFPPFTYAWSNGATTEDISNIAAGSYTLVVTDSNGCSDSTTFLLNNISSINTTSTITQVNCSGGSNGAIDLSISGGTQPYIVSWDNGSSSEDISGLNMGAYTVTITDDNNCTYNESIIITEIPGMNIIQNAVNNEICGNFNGSIDIDVTGGSGSYGYSWSNGEITQDISGLNTGTYSVTITDGNGCTTTATYNIINDVSNCSSFCYLDIVANTVTDDQCGSGNGAIDVDLQNVTSPYTVSWSNGETTDDITGLTPGTYTITVNDAAGCSETETFTVGNNTGNLAIPNSSTFDETCGNGLGSIDITVSGGTLPYTYNWSNASTNEDINNLSSGSFTVDVTDGIGCTLSQTFTINNNTGSLAYTYIITNDTCSASIGEIDLTVTGGNTPLTYSWATGETTSDIINLAAGNYTCTITDASGCVLTTNALDVINSSGSLTLVNSSVTNESCNDGMGAIDLTISGGTAPITHSWSNSATTEDINGLSAGVYSNTITDDNGCTLNTGNINVFNTASNLVVSTNLITDEICSNTLGAINVDVTGGDGNYTYTWDNGTSSQDLTNVTAGTYTLIVTDGNGCSTSHTETINNTSGTLANSNTIITNENCGNGNGAIDIIITGGQTPYNFNWSNGSSNEDQTGLSAGFYSCIVTDANGCSITINATVNNNASGLSQTNQVTSEICSNGNGAIDLTINGGAFPYTFTWSNTSSNEDLTGLSAGAYSCTITDNNGCIITTGDIDVTNFAPSLSATSTVMDEMCGNGNGSIDITVTGGTMPLTYTWDNATSIEDPTLLTAGNYTCDVTDANGCSISHSAIVANNAGTLSLDNVSITNETCGNSTGAIDITVSGGSGTITYAWSNSSSNEDITGLSAGNYSCTITDNNGCSVTTGNLTLTDDPGTLSLDNVIAYDEQCGNSLGAIDLTVSGGTTPYTYNWNTGATSQDLFSLNANNYSCTITDQNGCSVMANATVLNNSSNLTVSNSTNVNEACSNGMGSIDIDVTGGTLPYTFSWSNTETTEDISNLIAGTYTVLISDNNGCSYTHSETITNAGSGLTISNSIINDEICGNGQGSIDITISGGDAPYSFAWDNGSTLEDLSALSAGNYNLTVTDNNGCTTTASYTVNSNAGNLAISSANTIDENCGNGNGSIDITSSGGNAPLSYSWTNGTTTEDLVNLSAGNYDITITDNFGCSITNSYSVLNNTGGFTSVITSVIDENCGDGSGVIDVTTTGGTTPYTFIWDNGQSTEDLSGLSTGSYTINITDANGCSNTLDTVVNNITSGLLINNNVIQNENCSDSTGFIDLTLAGGAIPYTFAWSNGATTEDISGVTAGIYSCVITDNSGCSVNYSGTVGSNSAGLAASSVITNTICTANSGAIDVTVTSGNGPFTYSWTSGIPVSNCCDYTLDMFDTGNSWNGASIDVIVNGINVGNYTVLGGGVGSGTFNACDGDNIQLDFISGQWDNEISFNLVDPTGAIIYAHAAGNGPTPGSIFSTIGSCPGASNNTTGITNLNGGTYSLTITDNAGCDLIQSYTVNTNQNTNLAFSAVTVVDDNCGQATGSIDAVATGGNTYTYSLNGGTSQNNGLFTSLNSGSYTVSGYDENGCQIDSTVSIFSPGVFSVSDSVTYDYCNANTGSIDLTITGSSTYDFAWSNSETSEDISGLATGSYSVTISDSNTGCSQTLYYTILNTSNGMNYSAIVNLDSCNAGVGAIDLTMTGGSGSFNYDWSNLETTEDINGLTAGAYSVTITDSNDGCEMNANFTINGTGSFNMTGTTVDATCSTCNDGSINVTISGTPTLPITYSWDNGQTTQDISNLLPGSYIITATDANGCFVTDTFIVDFTSSIDDLNDSWNINIYPNPSTALFNINFDIDNSKEVKIDVFNVTGQLIETKSLQSGIGSTSFDLKNHANGTYFIKVSSNGTNSNHRIMLHKN